MNRQIITPLVALVLSAAGVSQCVAPIPTDPIALWPLDGAAVDVVGPHTGTISGTPTFGPAIIASGITFDSDDDRVDVPHMMDLNPAAPGFTVMFYIRGVHGQQTYYNVLEKSHGFTDYTGWCFEGVPVTEMLSWAAGDGTGGFPIVTSTIDVLDGVFHLVAGTWTSASGMLELFVDGASQGTALLPTPAGNTRTVNMGYAWGGGTPQRFFRGTIDHVQIYSRVLSQAEIFAFVGFANQHLSISQDPVSHDLTVCALGPGGAVFLVYSLDPLNATSPGTGLWGGLHLSIYDLINQLYSGFAGFPLSGGTLFFSQYSFTIPGVFLGNLTGLTIWGIAYVAGPIPGFSNIDSHTFF